MRHNARGHTWLGNRHNRDCWLPAARFYIYHLGSRFCHLQLGCSVCPDRRRGHDLGRLADYYPNFLSTSDGGNTISTSVLYDAASGNPIRLTVTESNKDQIFFQDFTFAGLSPSAYADLTAEGVTTTSLPSNVNTLIMNGTEGDDTFDFDPSLSIPISARSESRPRTRHQ